jgi:hypothetical protein
MVHELARGGVEQGGMEEKELIGSELRRGPVWAGSRRGGVPKKRGLEAETPLAGVKEVSGEVPPFHLELGVAAVVAGKRE